MSALAYLSPLYYKLQPLNPVFFSQFIKTIDEQDFRQACLF